MSKEYPWGKGTVTWVHDTATNDSDKSYVTPVGKIRDVKMIRAYITNTATVGNRNLSVSISDGTSVIFVPITGANSAASATYGIVLGAGFDYLSAATPVNVIKDDGVTVSSGVVSGLPRMLLPAGYIIRVYDKNAVDAAADDLVVTLHYVEYDA